MEIGHALCEASRKGDLKIIEKLISEGADVNAKLDNLGGTSLHVAASEGKTPAVLKGAKVSATNKHGCTPLHNAAYKGHVEAIKALHSSGAADVTMADKIGNTPLHLAASNDHNGVVALLLALGANVDAVNDAGRTALHRAACNGHVAAIRVLAANGADPSALDYDGYNFEAAVALRAESKC